MYRVTRVQMARQQLRLQVVQELTLTHGLHQEAPQLRLQTLLQALIL